MKFVVVSGTSNQFPTINTPLRRHIRAWLKEFFESNKFWNYDSYTQKYEGQDTFQNKVEIGFQTWVIRSE